MGTYSWALVMLCMGTSYACHWNDLLCCENELPSRGNEICKSWDFSHKLLARSHNLVTLPHALKIYLACSMIYFLSNIF